MKQDVILCVDDDVAILKLMTLALTAEGYTVLTAASNTEFNKIMKMVTPDIFLIDIGLPDGNGMRIARDLRTQTEAGIILVTGQTDMTDRILGLELGADDYITKPFNFRELRARVNAVYRRTAPLCRLTDRNGASNLGDDLRSVTRFHGFKLDQDSRQLSNLHDQEIDLTTLEFDVLAALVRHCNRVLSRDQLMDHVRGPGWSVYDRSIDGLVSRLRRKLFPDGSGTQKIRTVRGIGYMLSLSA